MSQNAHTGSPLDPFLARFLIIVGESDNGFQPGAESHAIASTLEIPAAFVDALFTSARTRGLLKPVYGRGGKVRWGVSASGQALAHAAQPPGDEASG